MRHWSVLVLTLLFIAGCSAAPSAATPGASATLGCEYLQVIPTSALNAPIEVAEVSCAHGVLVGDAAGRTEDTLVFRQSGIHGPDCNITFKVNASTYTIHVQQNFCELQAGQVTAKVLSGNATVTTQEGSFLPSTAGVVNVTLN